MTPKIYYWGVAQKYNVKIPLVHTNMISQCLKSVRYIAGVLQSHACNSWLVKRHFETLLCHTSRR